MLCCIMQAMAAHNTGGIVIVQVERVVASGSLPARQVILPGAIVDKASIGFNCRTVSDNPDLLAIYRDQHKLLNNSL